VAFRQDDGEVVWRSGDFLTAAAAPILIDLDGETQLVFLAGGTITGLDPATGRVLWSHPHDPGNDLNCSTPIWGPDNVLVVSSAYKAGSRAVRLRHTGSVTEVEELWFTNRVRFMFLGAIRLGDVVYGATGDFGPAFLTALDIRSGESLWQHRGFGRASLLHADGKTIIMDEDGDLALSRLTPEGATILAEAKVFDTVTWTAPTLVGTTLFARDREKIVALDLARAGGAPSPAAARSTGGSAAAASGLASAAPASIGSAARDRSGPAGPPVVLSGTWTLDSPRDAQAGQTLAGVSAAGAPPQLFVTQAANGTVVIESAVNGSQARYYRPGHETTTATLQGGTITMRSTWAGRALVADGVIRLNAGGVSPVKERFEVSPDGQVLTVEVGAESSQHWRYVRLRDMGPCETWPTPCKRQ
jgi:outer membrane protein assembly factor BamB